MSVEVLDGKGGAVLVCNTVDWAFGPLFASAEHAEDFLRWLRDVDLELIRECGVKAILPAVLDPRDPRSYEEGDLERIYHVWRGERLDEDGELRHDVVAT